MNRSFFNLAWLQAQIVFNDNACKMVLIGLVTLLLGTTFSQSYINIFALFTILPFVLFAPLAGWWSDVRRKSSIVKWCLFFQMGVMAIMFMAFYIKSLPLAAATFFILSTLCAFISPAKQGIIKEYVGESRLGMASGIIEMLTVVAILAGALLGGRMFDMYSGATPWEGAGKCLAILGFVCVMAWISSLFLEKSPIHSDRPFSISLFWEHFYQLKAVWRESGIRLSSLGIAFFYAAGGFLYLVLVDVGQMIHGANSAATAKTGLLMGIMGVGVICGSVIASVVSRHRIELGIIPLGALGMAGAYGAMAFTNPASTTFLWILFAGGVSGGLFVVPLNAFLQNRVPPAERGQLLAGMNLMTNVGAVAGILLHFGLVHFLGFNLPIFFLTLLVVTLAVAGLVMYYLPESLLRFLGGFVGGCIYRLRVTGAEKVPANGGVLLICNHVSYVDALVLQMACPRSIRFIMARDIYNIPGLNLIFRILNVIPINPTRAKEGIREAAEHLKAGDVICIFPEGELTRSGSLNALRKGFEIIARQADVPVVPVCLDNLWGSVFSFKEKNLLGKWPAQLRYPVNVVFGDAIPAAQANAEIARRALLSLNQQAFLSRPELDRHLGYEIIRNLKAGFGQVRVTDSFPKAKKITAGKLLGVSLFLATYIKKHCPEKRVAIVLPPGAGGIIANLGVVLAGKVPVNLNFTAGEAALNASIKRAEIKTAITADVFAKKINIPWPEHRIDLPSVLAAAPKWKILGWIGLAFLLPSRCLANLIELPINEGGKKEAAILFTSGSSGEPKGVVLSHRNLLANVVQFTAMINPDKKDAVMGTLPIFHSFGFLSVIWIPILRRVRVVTYPNPLDIKAVGDAIFEHGATIHLGTPTFLKSYVKKVEAEKLRSLRMVIAGAEKLPRNTAESFKEKFGVQVFEGYGLTETAPLLTVNTPPPDDSKHHQVTNKIGSTGKLAPGIAARIVDPDTGVDKPLHETGMLYVKGANIFEGYLNDVEKTDQVKKDGWFITGDLGRFDEDGFLFLEGRLSRFSKIGGEMVPHILVEEKLLDLLKAEFGDEVSVAIVGIPDAAKGEALVALCTRDFEPSSLRVKLNEAGLPNLWVPKKVVKVEALPLLGTGKLDLKLCQKIALEKAAEVSSVEPLKSV